MPLTRLANTIIDGVADNPSAIAADVERYLACDLVFYRASGPAGLVARQTRPGIRCSPGRAMRSARASCWRRASSSWRSPNTRSPPRAQAIPRDPWRLGALHSITTLTGSALIALALAGGALSVDAAWAAAHVDEDWNMDFWGRDQLALERRAARFAEMQAAAMVLQTV